VAVIKVQTASTGIAAKLKVMSTARFQPGSPFVFISEVFSTSGFPRMVGRAEGVDFMSKILFG
jgi:hypothetical protein